MVPDPETSTTRRLARWATGLAATVGAFLGGASVQAAGLGVCAFIRMLRAPGYGEAYEPADRQQRYRHTGQPPRDGGMAGR
ncbi:putative phosphoribosylglycinamide formyltransferase [Streptomyces azureus]|uniref:Putative phosphoribosylglycinamide formyltransferase n=1 Tax=Streptomyces azureus TaxID=146537 RepID=A0A0K8Q117_STRAJ|nr:putative phosphoribosylglycinamide formyltransferase [Streptomyces azureus]